jgi:hypothetical protein
VLPLLPFDCPVALPLFELLPLLVVPLSAPPPLEPVLFAPPPVLLFAPPLLPPCAPWPVWLPLFVGDGAADAIVGATAMPAALRVRESANARTRMDRFIEVE